MAETPAKRVTFGLLSLVLAMLLILGLSLPAFAQTKPQVDLTGKNVLVLHPLESNVPIFELTDHGLRATLDAGGVAIRKQFFEYLDLARNPGPEYRKHLAELMRLRYGKRKIDIIITLYPEALQFALDEGGTIFSDTPIVALYLPPGFEPQKTSRRIIRQTIELDMIGTLESALELVPGAKHVYVVAGAYGVDRKYEDEARRSFKKWEGQLEFRYLSDVPLQEILDTVSTVPPGSIVLLMGFAADVTRKNYTTREVGERLSQVSKAPVFGLLQVVLGYGIAGGKLVSFEYIGTKAGEMALDILRGTRATENIPPVLDVPSIPMFDWRQLRHWNLREGALPKGSIVINKELTFWDFKYYIIGGFALCLLQSLLIAGLLLQRRRKNVAKESLRQRTVELDQFFNIGLDLKCIANTDAYFLRLNPAWERILGYRREELMAKRFFEFVHPDDLDRTREAISNLASQQKIFLFENRYRCKDGTYRWLEWSSAPAGNLIYAAARDITERKQAEQALEERLRFERLASDISARFVNISPDRVDSEIEDGLRQILEFFQVDRCGLVRIFPGKTTWQITHIATAEGVPMIPHRIGLPASIRPWAYEKLILKHEVVSFSKIDDLPSEANVDRQGYIEWGVKSTLNIPIVTGGPLDHILAINSVKSERVWPEELIPRLRLLGEILVNALERNQMQTEIQTAAEEWQTTFDSIQDLVMILDPEFKLVRVNAATLSFFKLPFERILGKHCYDLMHGTNEPVGTCPLAKMIKTKTHEETELYDEKTDAWLHVSVDPIFDDKGQIIRVIHTVKNITEHKQAEAEASRAHRELLRMERLSRMGELTASLAHELNQPLAAILSNAQAGLRFLQSDKVNLDELREILQDITQDDQRAGNVIRSLRSMVKREELERKPVILNDVLNDVVQIFHTESVFRNVLVETEFDGSLPPVLGDKVQLQQVALNLILNAADAMFHNPHEHRQIILGTGIKDKRVRVTVRDFGPGIDQENADRIFEPFFTTKRAGLGMGLSVCRTIVEAHEGRIWAENNPDRGATFVFELPISEKSGE